MSATVIPFFYDASFDPETTHIMGQAYESACTKLHDVGQPEIVKNVIARRIIEIAKTGERDPNQLCKRALKAIRLPPQRT
jgi:hypothetical protein